MNRARGDAGVATVEFALVLPLFLLLISIGGFFAWWAFIQSQVDRAADGAARFAAVPTTDGTYAYCPSAVLDQVNSLLTGDALDAADVTVQTRTGVVTESTCPAATAPSGYVRVSVEHTFTNPFTWFIPVFTGGSGELTVRGSAQVRVEAP